jgi:hypothetical protein
MQKTSQMDNRTSIFNNNTANVIVYCRLNIKQTTVRVQSQIWMRWYNWSCHLYNWLLIVNIVVSKDYILLIQKFWQSKWYGWVGKMLLLFCSNSTKIQVFHFSVASLGPSIDYQSRHIVHIFYMALMLRQTLKSTCLRSDCTLVHLKGSRGKPLNWNL